MGQPQAPQPPPQSPAVPPQVPAALRSIGEALITATGGKKKPSWLPAEGWLWGLSPIIFAALRVLVVSRGDAETLRALVQNLNVTALVLATILPFGAAVSVISVISLYVASKTSGQAPGKFGPPLFVLLFVTSLVLVVVAMPVWQILIGTVAVAAAVFIFYLGKNINARAQQSGNTVRPAVMIPVVSALLATGIVPIIYMIGWSGVWLPKERITVSGVEVSPAYVLSSDQRWTTYMDERHKVHLAPTTSVTNRDTAEPSESWSDKPLAENLSDLFGVLGRQFARMC